MRAVAPDVAPLIRATVYPLLRDCRVGKANGSRERAPDDRLRVPTIVSPGENGGHGAKRAVADPTRSHLFPGSDITRLATSRFQMNSTTSAPMVAVMKPAPWSGL